jgi:hypothetical protein
LQYVGSRCSFLHPPSQVSLLATFTRSTREDKQTQQKIGFHIDWAGRFLLAGDADGHILIWHISLPSGVQRGEGDSAAQGAAAPAEEEEEAFFGKILRDSRDSIRTPAFRSNAASDVIASVTFHPSLALIAVASGARHWTRTDGDDSSSEDEEEESESEAKGHRTWDGALRLFVTE